MLLPCRAPSIFGFDRKGFEYIFFYLIDLSYLFIFCVYIYLFVFLSRRPGGSLLGDTLELTLRLTATVCAVESLGDPPSAIPPNFIGGGGNTAAVPVSVGGGVYVPDHDSQPASLLLGGGRWSLNSPPSFTSPILTIGVFFCVWGQTFFLCPRQHSHAFALKT